MLSIYLLWLPAVVVVVVPLLLNPNFFVSSFEMRNNPHFSGKYFQLDDNRFDSTAKVVVRFRLYSSTYRLTFSTNGAGCVDVMVFNVSKSMMASFRKETKCSMFELINYTNLKHIGIIKIQFYAVNVTEDAIVNITLRDLMRSQFLERLNFKYKGITKDIKVVSQFPGKKLSMQWSVVLNSNLSVVQYIIMVYHRDSCLLYWTFSSNTNTVGKMGRAMTTDNKNCISAANYNLNSVHNQQFTINSTDERILPFTEYKIYFQPGTRLGWGTKRMINFRTAEYRSSKPRSILANMILLDNALTIKWTAPKQPNGNIGQYIIMIETNKICIYKWMIILDTKTAVGSGGKEIGDLCSNQKTKTLPFHNFRNTSVTIVNVKLTKKEEYKISVQAKNGWGFGEVGHSDNFSFTQKLSIKIKEYGNRIIISWCRPFRTSGWIVRYYMALYDALGKCVYFRIINSDDRSKQKLSDISYPFKTSECIQMTNINYRFDDSVMSFSINRDLLQTNSEYRIQIYLQSTFGFEKNATETFKLSEEGRIRRAPFPFYCRYKHISAVNCDWTPLGLETLLGNITIDICCRGTCRKVTNRTIKQVELNFKNSIDWLALSQLPTHDVWPLLCTLNVITPHRQWSYNVSELMPSFAEIIQILKSEKTLLLQVHRPSGNALSWHQMSHQIPLLVSFKSQKMSLNIFSKIILRACDIGAASEKTGASKLYDLIFTVYKTHCIKCCYEEVLQLNNSRELLYVLGHNIPLTFNRIYNVRLKLFINQNFSVDSYPVMVSTKDLKSIAGKKILIFVGVIIAMTLFVFLVSVILTGCYFRKKVKADARNQSRRQSGLRHISQFMYNRVGRNSRIGSFYHAYVARL